MICTMKNKYIIRSRISEAKTKEIIKYFSTSLMLVAFARSLDIEAVKIAKLSNISRQSVNKIINQIRILIAKECEKTSKMQGEIEVDESNLLIQILGAKRVRGKRGRGAGKKTSVFLLYFAYNCKQKVC